MKFLNRESIADYINHTHSVCEVGVKNGEFFDHCSGGSSKTLKEKIQLLKCYNE